MRRVTDFNGGWIFSKSEINFVGRPKGEAVSLPHTYNGEDGQDGGNDYYRGKCWYAKEFRLDELPKSDVHFIKFDGVNSVAEVFLNGKSIAQHRGGYSAFSAELRELKEQNLLIVAVDNSEMDDVYPAFADFTFYGGIYRSVSIISLPVSHFDMEYYGGPGIRILPKMLGNVADVEIEVYLKNPREGERLKYQIIDREGKCVAERETDTNERKLSLPVRGAHRWCGKEDPYLYTARVSLTDGGEELDAVSSRFGCREFDVDPERGFILNGKPYPLRGVSRHQDRPGIGSALLPEHHEEDIDLILELGANAVRLAHYQHDSYFYDLCDEAGLAVWAEIPYISRHNGKATENTVSQMKELIIQNYNHPSIFFWGLSNEITMGGEDDPGLIENHVLLNGLAHSYDPSRKTVVAALSVCKTDAKYLKIPDLIAYNHYFGWYGGEVEMNGKWFDEFHKKYPNRPIGISEYGCEALNYHSEEPIQGDYTEEYQAYYHEELIKAIEARPYIFASFVWNMFDFGADARAEGGEPGQNHKGLVSFDRKYKKDAFYAYKAWLSDEPFVHIAEKRFEKRVGPVLKIKVYSSLPEVEVFANGERIGKSRGELGVFRFELPNTGEVKITAKAGELSDEAYFSKVDTSPEEYRLKDTHAVLSWYEIDAPKGKLSLNDKISDIIKTPEGKDVFDKLISKLDGAKNAPLGMELGENMLAMLGGFSLIRFAGLSETLGIKFSRDELLSINRKLNSVDKVTK